MSFVVTADPAASRPEGGMAPDREGAGVLEGYLIGTAESDLDLAEFELRRRESRWPVVASIATIVALSIALWLGIFALGSRIAAAL